MTTVTSSLRDIRIPRSAQGQPEKIVKDFVLPLFQAASDIFLVLHLANLADLAWLTWGFGGLANSGVCVKVMLLASYGENQDESSLHQIWHDCLGKVTCKTRFGMLAWLKAANRLELRVLTIPGRTNSQLTERLSEISGFVLITDTQGTSVEMLWPEVQKLAAHSTAEVRFRWSFGDPLRGVEKLWEEVSRLMAGRPEPTLEKIEANLTDLLRSTPAAEPPWSEQFEEPQGIQLFPHQSDAVARWARMGYKAIFKMCTGAGKTIASLAGVRALADHLQQRGESPPPVIVTVPTRVLADQWCREIRKMGFDDPLPAYNTFASWFDRFETCLEYPREDSPAFIVTTYSSFADDRFQRVLKRLQDRGHHVLWIADEMHNLASSRLLKLCMERSLFFLYRLGLSATPEIEFEPDKTEKLRNFFGGLAASFELKHGIEQKVLCQYRYYPCPCYLSPYLGREYLQLLQDIDSAEEANRPDINLYRAKRDLLRRSGVQVQAFSSLLTHLLQKNGRVSHTLVYCPPGYGSVRDERGAESSDDSFDRDSSSSVSGEARLLDEVITVLRSHNVEVSSILGESSETERTHTLAEFAHGRVQAVCAIGCLDEGVDIPSIKTAVILASVDREKQFIQRRGRILRRSRLDPQKIAEIYDIVILPQRSDMPVPQAEALLKKELRRYNIFADIALNQNEADAVIQRALNLATGDRTSTHPQTPHVRA